MNQLFQLGVGVLTLFLPGLALLLTAGLRSRLVIAGLSVPLTVGLVLIARVLTAVLGVGFNILSFLVVAAVLVAGSGALRWIAVRRTRPRPTEDSGSTESGRDLRAVLSGRTLQAVRLVGALSGLGGIALATWTWQQGLGSWSNPTQEHDPVTHSLIAAYIDHTGNAAPWELAPVSLIQGDASSFYPSGFSSLVALVANMLGDPMTAMNLVTVAALAVAWPLAAAALAAAMVRLGGLGKGWTDLAGGIAALVAAALYRPSISLAHDGGVLPNVTAIVLVPGLIAAMLLIRRRQWALMVALGVACAGALSIHPSVAVSTVLTLLAAWVGLLITRSGRHRLRASLLPMLGAGIVALVVSIPTLLAILSLNSVGSGLPPNIPAKPFGLALRNSVTLTYLGYFDPSGEIAQVAIGYLAVLGLVAVVVFRRGWPIATAYVFWVATSVIFQLSPTSGYGALIGRFFYSVYTRIQSHVSLLIPALVAGLCVFVAAALLAVRLPSRTPAAVTRSRPAILFGALAAALVVLTTTTLTDYASTNVTALSERYKDPQFVRYSDADRAAARWLSNHVDKGEVILNNANDGSTLAYIKYGLPIVNLIPAGNTNLPKTVKLLKCFNSYPNNDEIRDILLNYNIQWLYVDSRAPLIGTAAKSWNQGALYSLAPGFNHLKNLPGLKPVFKAGGHVTVYKIDLDVIRSLPSAPGAGQGASQCQYHPKR